MARGKRKVAERDYEKLISSTKECIEKLETKSVEIREELRSKKSHAEGLDKVPEDDYIANLHEGEMVVPKKGADDLREIGEDLEEDESESKISDEKGNKNNLLPFV